MEPENNTPATPAANTAAPELSKQQKSAITWAIISFGFAVFFHIFNTSHLITHAGFFAKLFSVLVATVLGTVGAVIGDGIRRFAMPDAIYTSGMGSTIKAKLFWMVGPQLIGMVLGAALGAALVLG